MRCITCSEGIFRGIGYKLGYKFGTFAIGVPADKFVSAVCNGFERDLLSRFVLAVVAVGQLFSAVMNQSYALAHDCTECKFGSNYFHGQRCLDGSVFLIGIRDRIRSLFGKIQSAEIDGILMFFKVILILCRYTTDDHVFRLGRKFVADDIGGFSFRKSRIRCVQSQRSDVRGRSVE